MQGIEVAECMRSHGVPSFPNPKAVGGKVSITGSGVNPSSPSFTAAQSAGQLVLSGGY